MSVREETALLLQDVYTLTHMQAGLGKRNLSLDINWGTFRSRVEGVLVAEGVELPELLDVSGVSADE